MRITSTITLPAFQTFFITAILFVWTICLVTITISFRRFMKYFKKLFTGDL